MLMNEYNEDKTMDLFRKEFIQEGETKGKAKEQYDIISRMLGQGLKTKDITLYTGIPMERIEEIQHSIHKH